MAVKDSLRQLCLRPAVLGFLPHLPALADRIIHAFIYSFVEKKHLPSWTLQSSGVGEARRYQSKSKANVKNFNKCCKGKMHSDTIRAQGLNLEDGLNSLSLPISTHFAMCLYNSSH